MGKSPQRKSRKVLCLITRTSSTQQERRDPCDTQSCVLMPTKIEEDQTRTVRPVKVEEHDIDFRVPGLSHAVVKEAEHLQVPELVRKIENHPHREALQADLQQNNVYNPFSKDSKEMNVELFEFVRNFFQKYNVLSVCFIGIKELCTALADNF